MNELRIAAPLFRDDAVLRQLVLDTIRIGLGLIDLVHGHDHRYTSSFRVLDGFDGLRHDAVVGRHHQDDHVGGFRTASTHGGKRRVTRGIQEGHATVVIFHMVGTDVLGNTARFASGDFRTTDIVQQRGLTVVDVTHDGDDR